MSVNLVEEKPDLKNVAETMIENEQKISQLTTQLNSSNKESDNTDNNDSLFQLNFENNNFNFSFDENFNVVNNDNNNFATTFQFDNNETTKFEQNFLHDDINKNNNDDNSDNQDENGEQNTNNDNGYCLIKPIVILREIHTLTGHEDEKLLSSIFIRNLYIFQNNEWKIRATNTQIEFYENNNRNIRLVVREQLTQKLRLNHYISPATQLNNKEDYVWTWIAYDETIASDYDYNCNDNQNINKKIAKNHNNIYLFGVKFKKIEDYQKFKVLFDQCGSSTQTDNK